MLGRLHNLFDKVFGKETEVPPEAPLVRAFRERIISEIQCSRLLEAATPGTEEPFTETFPFPEDNRRSGTAVVSLSVDSFLPDPRYFLDLVEAEEALSLMVLAKDPVPCNSPVPPEVRGRAYPLSSWLDALNGSDFIPHFQFEEPDLVLITARKGAPLILSEEGKAEARVEVSSSLKPTPVCGLHSGWTFENGVAVLNGMGVIYALNRCPFPVETTVSGTVDAPEGGTLRIHRAFTYIEDIWLEKGLGQEVAFKPIVLPPGGHGLQVVSVEGKPVRFAKIAIDVKEKSLDEFRLSLSFDQYQRHRAVSDVLSGLFSSKERPRILDVGGGGSLLASFLPNADVMTLDSRPYDRPNHVQDRGESLPFEKESFDAVVSVDTLEHVPESNRPAFLDELVRVSRRWVIVACPFKSDPVDRAEQLLARFESEVRKAENAFLNEHLSNGLPDLQATMDHLKKSLPSLARLPNGWLPRWFSMMIFQSAIVTCLEFFPLGEKIGRLYNKNYYRFDNADPSYRSLLIGSKMHSDVEIVIGLSNKLSSENPSGNPSLEDPRKLMDFYGIPVSESFDQWYKDNRILLRNETQNGSVS